MAAMRNRFKDPVLIDYDHFSYDTEKSSAAGVRLVREFLKQARQSAGRAGRER